MIPGAAIIASGGAAILGTAATIAAYMAVMLLTSYLSAALAPKPPQPKPSLLEDFNVPMAEEGRPVGMVFGHVVIKSATLAWYGNLATEKIKKKTGKK
jgi:hypothetical protein